MDGGDAEDYRGSGVGLPCLTARTAAAVYKLLYIDGSRGALGRFRFFGDRHFSFQPPPQ